MVDTDQILLKRLTSLDDQAAWREFFERYWTLIVHYANGVGLSRTQAEDVLQETMVVLMRVMPRFKYDSERGRFRGYLRTVVKRLCFRVRARMAPERDAVNFDALPEAGRADPALSAVEELERRDENGDLWEQSLFNAALKIVLDDPRLDRRTRLVFWACVVENRDVILVAKEQQLPPNAIYQIKHRILKRVKLEVGRLRRDLGA